MSYLCLVERGVYDIPFRWLDPIAKHFGMNEQESATLQKLAIEAGVSYKEPRQKARLNEFGKIIDGLRQEHGETRKELAEAIGTHTTALFQAETGKTNVPGKLIKAIGRHYGLTHEEQINLFLISHPNLTDPQKKQVIETPEGSDFPGTKAYGFKEPEFLSPYGKFVRRLRAIHGESIKDLTEVLNARRNFISDVERGVRLSVPEHWFNLLVEHYNLSEKEQRELAQAIEDSNYRNQIIPV